MELYEYAADCLDTDPTAVAHVNNGQFDVQSAIYARMQGVWLNRQDAPTEPVGLGPDFAIESFEELVAML